MTVGQSRVDSEGIADRVGFAGRYQTTSSFGYSFRAPFPFVGSGGSTMWSLNPYRFGRLSSTSILPHGVWTHPPSAGLGRWGCRSLPGGRRLVGRFSRREPDLPVGCLVGFEELLEGMLRKFDWETSAAFERSRPKRC